MNDAGAGLGNIFDAVEGEGPRGEDLFHTIEMPRSALGHPGGQLVPVPEKIVHAGERVRRVADADPEPGWVHLQLGADVPEGARLRLRGQGEAKTDGRPGDLILTLRFNEDAPVRLPPGPSLVRAAGTGVATRPGNSGVIWGLLAFAIVGVVLALVLT